MKGKQSETFLAVVSDIPTICAQTVDMLTHFLGYECRIAEGVGVERLTGQGHEAGAALHVGELAQQGGLGVGQASGDAQRPLAGVGKDVVEGAAGGGYFIKE